MAAGVGDESADDDADGVEDAEADDEHASFSALLLSQDFVYWRPSTLFSGTIKLSLCLSIC